MVSAHQIISSFDSSADYVIVENPARFTSGVFFHSKLPELLERFNAPTIQIPRMWLNANDVDGLKEGWIVDLDKGRSRLRDCNAAAFERKAIDPERRKRKANAKMVKPDCDR
jgi:hypothetical protein